MTAKDGYSGSFPTGNASIYRLRPNENLPLFSPNETAFNRAGKLNNAMMKIDTVLGSTQGGFPVDTSGLAQSSNRLIQFNANRGHN